jgi:nucleotide-binding universal stress UspA family protein
MLRSRVERGAIFHPSDFTEASDIAFAHALKMALVSGATLHMLHVSDDSPADGDFPGVRDTLERWGLITPGSPRSAVAALGIAVHKVVKHHSDPVKASLDFLSRHPADIVVLAVHRREGRMHWLHRPVGEPIARGAGEVTLFIPHGVEGFVSRASGAVSLRRILIPVVARPSADPALAAAARLVRSLQLTAGEMTLLHVGTAGDAPLLHCPDVAGWTWQRVTRPGGAADTIVQVAGEIAADLIVMTTDGPDGFLDGLRGTTSAEVLHKAPCPVANLPEGSREHGSLGMPIVPT